MSKQTSIEFLIKEFTTLANASILGKIDNVHFIKRKQEIIDQAKEMEKQQIIDAVNSQQSVWNKPNGEEYYNNTFKGE